MKQFDLSFFDEFAQDDIVVMRFTSRLKSQPDSLRFAIKAGLPSELKAFAKAIIDDDDVLNAGCEYLHSVCAKYIFRIYGIKSDDDVVEEVD